MLHDFRLAGRALRRQWTVSVAAVLTVALAVSANTALFSIFDGLMFRPLPFGGTERMVHVTVPQDVRRRLSRPELEALDTLMGTTPLLERRTSARPSELLEEGALEVQAWGLRPVAVTPGWFAQFGLRPVAGQLVDPGNDTGFLMSEDIWRARYGADRSLIGTRIRLPGDIFPERQPPILAGIVPREFSQPDGANLWFGSGLSTSQYFEYAHLPEGITIEQVRAVLPDAVITPYREYIRPGGSAALAVLLIATGLFLLVAWVQVAALLFSRATGRVGEIGIRIALGAGQHRIVRQFLAEGAVIVVAALTMAWIVTPLLTSGVIALLPDGLTRGQALMPDIRAFGFSVALSLVGVAILVAVPAGVIRRLSPVGLLRGAGQPGAPRRAARWRTALLVGQLAVTTMLLYLSGLAISSFDRVLGVDIGFEPTGVMAFLQPPVTTTAGGPVVTPESRRAHLQRQLQAAADTYQALRLIPGVSAAAGGSIPMFQRRMGGGGMFDIRVAGESVPSERAILNTTTPDYARVLGLTVVEGRLPVDSDLSGEPVGLVNESFARVLAARGDVLGQLLTANNRTSRVIGVVKDFSLGRPDRPVEPMLLSVLRSPQAFFLVKLDAGPARAGAEAAVAATFERFWPGHPRRNLMSLDRIVDDAVADYRARATMLVLIGAMCLPLALIGVMGAFGFDAQLRRRELALRLALGAQPSDVQRAVLWRATRVVAAALVIGVAGGVLIGEAMSAYLFGVRTLDPVTIVGVAAGLVALGLAAAWVPGRRASRTNPAEALRSV
ncbi:MAG: hypothetical protein AMXMBFR57_18480 [Acidimicrobiia bacterium]